MAEIIWAKWQEKHITERHGVSSRDFDEAWHDPAREDLEEAYHEQHGPYMVSVGGARGKGLIMAWRWQHNSDAVWPVTAYFPKAAATRKVKRRKK